MKEVLNDPVMQNWEYCTFNGETIELEELNMIMDMASPTRSFASNVKEFPIDFRHENCRASDHDKYRSIFVPVKVIGYYELPIEDEPRSHDQGNRYFEQRRISTDQEHSCQKILGFVCSQIQRNGVQYLWARNLDHDAVLEQRFCPRDREICSRWVEAYVDPYNNRVVDMVRIIDDLYETRLERGVPEIRVTVHFSRFHQDQEGNYSLYEAADFGLICDTEKEEDRMPRNSNRPDSRSSNNLPQSSNSEFVERNINNDDYEAHGHRRSFFDSQRTRDADEVSRAPTTDSEDEEADLPTIPRDESPRNSNHIPSNSDEVAPARRRQRAPTTDSSDESIASTFERNGTMNGHRSNESGPQLSRPIIKGLETPSRSERNSLNSSYGTPMMDFPQNEPSSSSAPPKSHQRLEELIASKDYKIDKITALVKFFTSHETVFNAMNAVDPVKVEVEHDGRTNDNIEMFRNDYFGYICDPNSLLYDIRSGVKYRIWITRFKLNGLNCRFRVSTEQDSIDPYFMNPTGSSLTPSVPYSEGLETVIGIVTTHSKKGNFWLVWSSSRPRVTIGLEYDFCPSNVDMLGKWAEMRVDDKNSVREPIRIVPPYFETRAIAGLAEKQRHERGRNSSPDIKNEYNMDESSPRSSRHRSRSNDARTRNNSFERHSSIRFNDSSSPNRINKYDEGSSYAHTNSSYNEMRRSDVQSSEYSGSRMNAFPHNNHRRRSHSAERNISHHSTDNGYLQDEFISYWVNSDIDMFWWMKIGKAETFDLNQILDGLTLLHLEHRRTCITMAPASKTREKRLLFFSETEMTLIMSAWAPGEFKSGRSEEFDMAISKKEGAMELLVEKKQLEMKLESADKENKQRISERLKQLDEEIEDYGVFFVNGKATFQVPTQ
ncbi:hypothetical protein CAEBREN_30242 [Caenorhabditis brenneri]|uniref:Uncharacterized protein n=1 Tax=Caenorhabditis brenneri TaxID=135651 RepID=G0PCY0_CAEBE|nr:hypothetical protein CAEBREN_30242 [Caenorhabditis brenneri]